MGGSRDLAWDSKGTRKDVLTEPRRQDRALESGVWFLCQVLMNCCNIAPQIAVWSSLGQVSTYYWVDTTPLGELQKAFIGYRTMHVFLQKQKQRGYDLNQVSSWTQRWFACKIQRCQSNRQFWAGFELWVISLDLSFLKLLHIYVIICFRLWTLKFFFPADILSNVFHQKNFIQVACFILFFEAGF